MKPEPAMPPMRIALTGTPGVGKTTLAHLCAQTYGWRVVDLRAWATATGAVVAFDEADQADVIDVEGLAEEKEWEGPATRTTLYEGHLAHHLPVDAAWVLRCDPDLLRPRLEARGYSAAKVRENLEAEALDIILQECLDRLDLVVQRDATRRSPDELATAFESAARRPGHHDLEGVDWSDRLPIR